MNFARCQYFYEESLILFDDCISPQLQNYVKLTALVGWENVSLF